MLIETLRNNSKETIHLNILDFDPRRLEYRSVERNGENISMGRTLLRRAHDFRQLRPL